MTRSLTSRLGVCVISAAMTVATSVPGLAAEPPIPTRAPSRLLASAQKQVRHLANAAVQPTRLAQEGAGGYDTPGSFFKTRRGIALLVIAGAGIGYMWYSKVHDRIHSDARARLD